MPKSPGISLSWPSRLPTHKPSTSALLLPVSDGDPRTRLVQGDNLAVLSALHAELQNTATLIYLDPPFLTMRQHDQVTRLRSVAGRAPVRILTPAFDDRWDGLTDYLTTLRERLLVLRQLLAPHGSIVVHVDPRTSHYVRVVGDEIFGPDAFVSEIIWRYRRWPSKTPNFQRVHDVLLRWVKDPRVEPRFVQLYEPLAPSTIRTWGKGKQQALFDDTGRRRKSSTTEHPSPGVPLGDVWEIPILAPVAKERTGYPTQKPEALLERIILSCSLEGDLVIDPYAGSGSTLAVSARLKRNVLGIDRSQAAISVARERLRKNRVSFQEFCLSSDEHEQAQDFPPHRRAASGR